MTPNEQLVVQATSILEDVKFLDYSWEVRESHGGVFLQGLYVEADVYTGKKDVQRTRKWLLSPMMSRSEIVSTCFKACLTSMEHRAREGFTYRGARIFGPHFDVDDLARLCQSGRENAGGR